MMSDLISRQAAIDAVTAWLNKAINPNNRSKYNDGEIAAYETALSELKKIQSAQPEQRLIPCSERLPKKVGDYLVTTHNGQIARFIYMDTNSSKEYWMRCAAAWMPLPKPWKGEAE